MNNAAVNIHVHVFVCGHVFLFLLGTHLGAELLGHTSTGNPRFNFLRNYQTVSCSGSSITPLYSFTELDPCRKSIRDVLLVPILQMETLRLREVKFLLQDHACEGRGCRHKAHTLGRDVPLSPVLCPLRWKPFEERTGLKGCPCVFCIAQHRFGY